MINALDFASIENLVQDYLDSCSQRKDQEPYHVKKNCEHTIYNIINQLEVLNYDVNTIEGKKLSFFKEIEEITTIDDLKTNFISIIEDIKDSLAIPNSYYHNIAYQLPIVCQILVQWLDLGDKVTSVKSLKI